MTLQQIVATAVRLFSVWLGLSGALIAVTISSKWGNGVNWMAAIFLLFYFLICVLIWIFPLTIANKIVPRMPEQEKVGLSALSFIQAAVSIMGLWFLASGILSITSFFITGINYFFGVNNNFQSLSFEWKVFIAAKFTSIIGGMTLISNSRRIAAKCIGARRDDHVDENSFSA